VKVLVADDDATMRTLIEYVLSKAGHEPLLARDGTEALELAVRETPQIVLTDWMMPGLDGVELCRRLRDAVPGAPYVYIIILTARDKPGDTAHGLEAGADDYITKPFDARELLARIRVGERIVRLEAALRGRNEALEQSLRTIRRLKGLLPICSICKKVRNDENYWQQIESYIHEQTGTDFSHGLCPDCVKAHYPEQYKSIREKERRRRDTPPPRDADA